MRAKIDFLMFEQMLNIASLVNRDRFEDGLMELIKEESFPERYKLILPPDRFKLYYINQGICKRVAVGMQNKLSDDFKVTIDGCSEDSTSVTTLFFRVCSTTNLCMRVLTSWWLSLSTGLTSWNCSTGESSKI